MPEQTIKLLFTAGSYMTVYRNPDPDMVRKGQSVLMYDGNVLDFDLASAHYLLTTFPDNFCIIENEKRVNPARHEEIMKTLKAAAKIVEDKKLDSVGTGHQTPAQAPPAPPAASEPAPDTTGQDEQEDPNLDDLTLEEKSAYTRALKKAAEGKQLTEFEEAVVKKIKAAAKG